MKKKYFADPEKQAVWDEVLAETKRAADQHQDGSWITYLVRDPRGSDKKGRLPVCVQAGHANSH